MLYILLAAYNEEKNLPEVFKEIQNQSWKFPYKVVVVNDGSSDKTHDIVESQKNVLPIVLIDHSQNKGLGAALATGFSFLKDHLKDQDMAATLDADNTHPVEIIPLMIKKIENGNDVVVASRYCEGGAQSGLSIIRRILSKGASVFLGIFWPLKGISDYSNGYRMYTGNLINKILQRFNNNLIQETGFAANIELLIKASFCTGKFAEVPLSLHYERKANESKMKILKTIPRYVFLVFYMRFFRRKIRA